MKLYLAIIDEIDNVHTSVVTAEPMDMLKQIFISLPTGEFDLSKSSIRDRVEEINTLWATQFADIPTPVEVIEYISRVLTAKGHDEETAEELAEELMIFELSDDGPNLVDFLSDLRDIFKGNEYDMSSMSDSQTTLIARIEL